MFFFQDNIGFLIRLHSTPFLKWIITPEAEHFEPITHALFFLEYSLFGLNFPLYLIVSGILHLANCVLLYSLARDITRNNFLSIIAVSFFAINLTYTEPILWNLQGLLLSTSLIALAFFFWRKYILTEIKYFFIISLVLLILSAFSYGLGTGAGAIFTLTTIIFAGMKKKRLFLPGVIYLIIGVATYVIGPVIARSIVSDIVPQVTNPIKEILLYPAFVFAGISRGVVGRFFLPGFEPRHTEILATVISFSPFFILSLVLLFLWKRFSPDKKFLLISLGIFIFYPYVWSGFLRSHYGLKQALAERYAYPTLLFFSLFFVLILQELIKRRFIKNKIFLILFVLSYLIMQTGVFVRNAYLFEIKPQETKQYFSDIEYLLKNSSFVLDLPLPSYINQEFTISQLSPLISPVKTSYISPKDFCKKEFIETLKNPKIFSFYIDQFSDAEVSRVMNNQKLLSCLSSKKVI